MSITKLKAPEWHLCSEGSRMELQLVGDWVACQTGIRSEADVRHIVDQIEGNTLRINSSALGQWDSALIAFLKSLRETISKRQQSSVRIDESDLPEPRQTAAGLGFCKQERSCKYPHAFVFRGACWRDVLSSLFRGCRGRCVGRGDGTPKRCCNTQTRAEPAAPTSSSKYVRQERPHSGSLLW